MNEDNGVQTGWNFPEDLLEAAWGIIANAHGGNWEKASPEWKEAAEKWRVAYFQARGFLPPTEVTEGE